jgi:hypothetical protein
VEEDLLFISSGLATGDGLLFHARPPKQVRPGCPAKAFNPFPVRDLPLPKDAPYPLGVRHRIGHDGSIAEYGNSRD